MKKKILIAILMVLCQAPIIYAYDFSAVCSTGQTLYYSITNSQNHTVSVVPPMNIFHNSSSDSHPFYVCYGSYPKPSGNLKIPETVTYNGITYLVTGIGKNAFYGCTHIKTVEIGKNVERIEEGAFGYDTYYPENVELNTVIWNAKNITYVYNSSLGNPTTFSLCNQLRKIIIGDSVQTFPSNAFKNCTHLDTVIWNAHNITYYPSDNAKHPFIGCSSLHTVIFGDSVQSVPARAFRGCSSITSVSMGNGIKAIGQSAFYGCINLTSVTIPNSVIRIGR